MRIRIHAGFPFTRAAEQSLRRRIGFALGRFDPRIERLVLDLRDVDGPRGGDGFACRARVRLRRPPGEVVVSGGGPDALPAACAVIERVRQAVARTLDRRGERPWRRA